MFIYPFIIYCVSVWIGGKFSPKDSNSSVSVDVQETNVEVNLSFPSGSGKVYFIFRVIKYALKAIFMKKYVNPSAQSASA